MSPILKGAQNKVMYVKSQVTSQNLPAELVPYLSGLLFSNAKIGSRQSEINAALNVWFKKYAELKNRIASVTNVNLKNTALLKLNEGNFIAVEQLLNVKTSYQEIIKTFPNSFQTNGPYSPIIIGDYATVSYVVKEIITYKLPEGLTINLLNELKAKDRLLTQRGGKIAELKSSLNSNIAIIKDYIARYNSIKEQLKNSPSEIYRKAYAFVNIGDFQSALKVLDSPSQNEKMMGKSNMLKAKLLLLGLKSTGLDASLQAIDKAYNIGVTLSPSAENYFDYAKFLVDYLKNYPAAIPFLEKSEALSSNKLERLRILNYLGIAYSVIDKVKSNEIHERAVKMLDEMEPLTDRADILLKAQLFSNIAAGYSTRFFDVTNIKGAIESSKNAVSQFDRLSTLSNEEKLRKAMLYNQNGLLYAMIGDTLNAMAAYEKATLALEAGYAVTPGVYDLSLVAVYYNTAELHYSMGRANQAIHFLRKALELTGSKISLDSRVYILTYEQIYTALLKNYVALNMISDVIAGLHQLRAKMQPFVDADPKNFLLHKAWTDTDLGSIYVNMRQPDSAKKYLKPAYDYYLANVNMVQYDKAKFSTCLVQMNELMLQSGEAIKAIADNRMLLTKFASIAGMNRIAYDDLIPQVERQSARAFTVSRQKDSAIAHIQVAINILEPKAKQYGTLYLAAYGDVMLHLFMIRLEFKDYDLADQVVKKFDSDCKLIIDVDPFVKSNMQSNIGECITNFAINLYGFTQLPQNNGIPSKVLDNLFKLDASYFELAAGYFDAALKNNPRDGIKYTQSLSAAIYLQNFLFSSAKGQMEKSAYKKRKCEIVLKARGIASGLVVNPFTQSLLSNINSLGADCN